MEKSTVILLSTKVFSIFFRKLMQVVHRTILCAVIDLLVFLRKSSTTEKSTAGTEVMNVSLSVKSVSFSRAFCLSLEGQYYSPQLWVHSREPDSSGAIRHYNDQSRDDLFFGKQNNISACEKSGFPCQDGKCVDKEKFQDGREDCSDGSDEGKHKNG